MTGREWQHGLFFRDRWTVNSKITLDLGVPLGVHHHAPCRSRHRARRPRHARSDSRRPRRKSPTNVGLSAGKDNFAPRSASIYRLNDDTVVRGGYGVTYNPMPWSRAPLATTRIRSRSRSASPATTRSAPSVPSSRAFPIVTGPDTSSGRVRCRTPSRSCTPELGNVDRGTIQTWNLSFERRLPWDCPSTSPTSAPGAMAICRRRHQRRDDRRR